MATKLSNEDEVRRIYRRVKMSGNREAMNAVRDVAALLRPGLDATKGSEASVEMGRTFSGDSTLERKAAGIKHEQDYNAYLRQAGVADG